MSARKRSTTPSKSIAPRTGSPSTGGLGRRISTVAGRKSSPSGMRPPSAASSRAATAKSSGRSPSRPDSAKSDASNSEQAKLRAALEIYETENIKLKNEVEKGLDTVRAIQQKMADQEKTRQQMSKKLFNTEKSLRFEKMACDGLKKKAGLWEAEHNVLLEEKNTMLIEQKRLQARIDHLQRCLNSDRAKRLKDMHENEKLRRDNEQLRKRVAELEVDNVQSNTSLLEKIHQLETAHAHADLQQRTIDAQAEEMINLARETCLLQEKQQTLINRSVRLEDFASTRARERDMYESEVKRLRTELLSVSLYQGDKSMAYDGAKALSKPRLKSIKSSGLSTRGSLSPSRSLGGLAQSYSTNGLVGVLPLESEILSDARSTSAKILRSAARKHRNDYKPTEDKLTNYAVGGGSVSTGGSIHSVAATAALSSSVHSAPTGGGFGSSSQRPHHLRPVTEYATVVGSRGAATATADDTFGTFPVRNTFTAGTGAASPGSTMRAKTPSGNGDMAHAHGEHERRASKKKASMEELSEMSVKPKSLFVGSGLGMRNPTVPDFNPQGSAKQVLKKIMAQFEEDYGKV